MTDWATGLAGGLLIGLAAALFLLGNGRIMGASGLIGGLVDGSAGSRRPEGVCFIAGLIGVPALLQMLSAAPVSTGLTGNLGLVVLAGLLVGAGTRIGNGCTSGHGVCGISRLSLRGIVATLCYIGAGVVTVALLRLVTGGL
ncbi:YeeE/YedE family protein [Roseobacter ponti]|uniref:YeeE/YedE family protein n=1 Tax=Roseobacter ponti TaxID=1891787 RepID=A0A858SUK7_9RHOB|nr:YeeE/YedE family protein [Roseobacter ponti]QJF51658.1 YeeE/YedE family protein [Roseobacter ponti]